MYKIFNVSKMKQAIKEAGLTIKEFAPKIGMGESGFHAAMKNGSFSIVDLEKSIKILGKPATYFFEEIDINNLSIHQNHNGVGNNNVDLQNCLQLLTEKERTIELLQNHNKILEELLKNNKP